MPEDQTQWWLATPDTHTHKREPAVVDFADPTDHRVKIKESDKRDKY